MSGQYNAQEHFDKLQDIEGSIAAAIMVCEGLSYANGQLMDDQFKSVATGAFRLLAVVLSKTFDTLDHEASAFRVEYGVKYPYEIKLEGESA